MCRHFIDLVDIALELAMVKIEGVSATTWPGEVKARVLGEANREA